MTSVVAKSLEQRPAFGRAVPAEPWAGELVEAAGGVGMVGRVQQVDDGAVGLRLGREVGPRGLLDLDALGGLAAVGGVHAGQSGGAEVDDVAGGDLQAEL